MDIENRKAPGLFISLGVEGPPEGGDRGGHLGRGGHIVVIVAVGAILVLGGEAARRP